MPPQIEQVGKLLKVKVYEVAELPEMDEIRLSRSRCDPYACVEFAGVRVKTENKAGRPSCTEHSDQNVQGRTDPGLARTHLPR